MLPTIRESQRTAVHGGGHSSKTVPGCLLVPFLISIVGIAIMCTFVLTSFGTP